MADDLVARIDDLLAPAESCVVCGGPMEHSPDQDFCGQDCQYAWNLTQAKVETDCRGETPGTASEEFRELMQVPWGSRQSDAVRRGSADEAVSILSRLAVRATERLMTAKVALMDHLGPLDAQPWPAPPTMLHLVDMDGFNPEIPASFTYRTYREDFEAAATSVLYYVPISGELPALPEWINTVAKLRSHGLWLATVINDPHPEICVVGGSDDRPPIIRRHHGSGLVNRVDYNELYRTAYYYEVEPDDLDD